MVQDIIAPNLKVLFCGINPGLYSAEIGHNFGRPGNRFWPALFHSGFTDRLLHPSEEKQLLRYGCGIINFVSRPTASAADLTKDELISGGKKVIRKVTKYKPKCLAVVGLTAYRIALSRPKAHTGLQQDFKIGDTDIWILPNPSGLNAHHQLPDLIRLFRELRLHAF